MKSFDVIAIVRDSAC